MMCYAMAGDQLQFLAIDRDNKLHRISDVISLSATSMHYKLKIIRMAFQMYRILKVRLSLKPPLASSLLPWFSFCCAHTWPDLLLVFVWRGRVYHRYGSRDMVACSERTIAKVDGPAAGLLLSNVMAACWQPGCCVTGVRGGVQAQYRMLPRDVLPIGRVLQRDNGTVIEYFDTFVEKRCDLSKQPALRARRKVLSKLYAAVRGCPYIIHTTSNSYPRVTPNWYIVRLEPVGLSMSSASPQYLPSNQAQLRAAAR